MGLTFPTALGLAAGFDKNAVGIDALAALGLRPRRGRHGDGRAAARQPDSRGCSGCPRTGRS